MHENSKWIELYNSIERQLLDEVLAKKAEIFGAQPPWLEFIVDPKRESETLDRIKLESINFLGSREKRLLQNEIMVDGKYTTSEFLLDLNRSFKERFERFDDRKDAGDLRHYVVVTLQDIRRDHREKYDPSNIGFENDYDLLFKANEEEIMSRLIESEITYYIIWSSKYDIELGFRKPDKSVKKTSENFEHQTNTQMGSVESIISVLNQGSHDKQELEIPEEMKAILKVPKHWSRITDFFFEMNWVYYEGGTLKLSKVPKSKRFVSDIIWKLKSIGCFNDSINDEPPHLLTDEEILEAWSNNISGYKASSRSIRGNDIYKISNSLRSWCKDSRYLQFLEDLSG